MNLRSTLHSAFTFALSFVVFQNLYIPDTKSVSIREFLQIHFAPSIYFVCVFNQSEECNRMFGYDDSILTCLQFFSVGLAVFTLGNINNIMLIVVIRISIIL